MQIHAHAPNKCTYTNKQSTTQIQTHIHTTSMFISVTKELCFYLQRKIIFEIKPKRVEWKSHLYSRSTNRRLKNLLKKGKKKVTANSSYSHLSLPQFYIALTELFSKVSKRGH